MFSLNGETRRSVKYWLLFGVFVGNLGMRVGDLLPILHTNMFLFLFPGLLLCMLQTFIAAVMLRALETAAQRYVLCFVLWRTHCFPWRVVPFLNDAITRILLRRVAGGYSFPHRLLLDYFADLPQETS